MGRLLGELDVEIAKAVSGTVAAVLTKVSLPPSTSSTDREHVQESGDLSDAVDFLPVTRKRKANKGKYVGIV